MPRGTSKVGNTSRIKSKVVKTLKYNASGKHKVRGKNAPVDFDDRIKTNKNKVPKLKRGTKDEGNDSRMKRRKSVIEENCKNNTVSVKFVEDGDTIEFEVEG